MVPIKWTPYDSSAHPWPMDFTVGKVDFEHTCLDWQFKISSGQVKFGVSRPDELKTVNFKPILNVVV